MKKNKAFTLQEVLITALIIGIVAAMTIPSLVNSARGEMNGLILKNFTTYTQQLISRQLVKEKTRNIEKTIFANPEELLSPDSGMYDSVRYCKASTAKADCWKINGNSNPKVTYKTLNGEVYNNNFFERPTIIMKNGVVVGAEMEFVWGMHSLSFLIDVNGPKGPNIVGVDLFRINMDPDGGKLVAPGIGFEKAQRLLYCKNGDPDICFTIVMDSDWKIDYDD